MRAGFSIQSVLFGVLTFAVTPIIPMSRSKAVSVRCEAVPRLTAQTDGAAASSHKLPFLLLFLMAGLG